MSGLPFAQRREQPDRQSRPPGPVHLPKACIRRGPCCEGMPTVPRHSWAGQLHSVGRHRHSAPAPAFAENREVENVRLLVSAVQFPDNQDVLPGFTSARADAWGKAPQVGLHATFPRGYCGSSCVVSGSPREFSGSLQEFMCESSERRQVISSSVELARILAR